MKHILKHSLSMLTACMMSFSMLSYLPQRIVQTSAATADEDKTDLTIDFDKSAISPEEALKDLYFDNQHTETFLEDNYDKLKWKPVYYWTCNNNPNGWSAEQKRSKNLFGVLSSDDWKENFKNYVSPYSLRTCLESTDEDYTYISLAADDDHDECNRDPWETINITTDKVLDLNGHTMNIRFDRNCNNDEINIKSEKYQNNVDLDTHDAVAFNISNGATLTIVDSSAWRGEGTDGKGTGRINFTAYMIDPFKWAIFTYTTRDLFKVSDGNLVIYGGTFQAGRKKAQMPDNFSVDKLKTVIGTTVELGVSIAEYSTGLNVAVNRYKDIATKLKQDVDKSALEAMESSGKENSGDASAVIERDGTNGEVHKETQEGVPDKKPEDKQRNQTIGEKDADQKKDGDNTAKGENKANEKGNAKEEKGDNEKLAEAQNAIVNKATDSKAIGSIVDKAFSLGQGIYDMLGKDLSKIVTQTIQGTVVKVGNRGSFVSYGGTFIGYGSTPNTRNAVIEVYNQPEAGPKDDDLTKNKGGVAYIYDGLFEAYSGANVFNMICDNENQLAWQYTSNPNGGHGKAKQIPLNVSETGGVEVLYYQNQKELTETGGNATPIPINTANVQVRGGTFRCHYDLRNVAINPDNSEGNPKVSDEEKFQIFPGTSGSVNLGPESYNTKLIQDGRIQIEDPYGAGALVLMDERSAENAGNEGLYFYRLFCTDTELRYKTYLRVYPNKDQQIRASRSMQLSTYKNINGEGGKTEKITSQLFTSDTAENDIDKDNIRAPYRQTEYYFDYKYDDTDAESYFVMPNFYNSKSDMMDVYGNGLGKNEIWYYPKPTNADLKPLPDVGFNDYCVSYQNKSTDEMRHYHARDMQKVHNVDTFFYGDGWKDYISKFSKGSVSYRYDEYDSIHRNLRYFTYKVYRVDPLTRENISESKVYGVDDPLIKVCYGASDDSLKCKLPLKMLEREIKARRPELNWQGYQDGEMYRIVLSVDEYLEQGFGKQINLPTASTETSILFRCYSDTKDTGKSSREKTFTPLKWDYNASTHSTSDEEFTDISSSSLLVTILAKLAYLSKFDAIASDRVAQISILNGKAGMVDYNATKVFDIYYQWWEVDENGDPIRLLAGTDNVYDRSMWPHSDHKPSLWNIGKDGKTYVNTVDPNDPQAKTYDTNGLPKVKTKYGPDGDWEWKDYQLHLYSNETIDRRINGQDGLTVLHKESDKNLSLANNDVFATGTDKCYIPHDMAGKYLRVKVIAINDGWELAYDRKQTFWSKTVKVVDSVGELETKAKVEFSDDKDYATYEHPATLSVDEIKTSAENLDQILNKEALNDGEVISSVEYRILNGPANCKDVVFDNLKITDPTKLPTAKYPDDFYDFEDESRMAKIKPLKVSYRVIVKTSRANSQFRTSISNTGEFNYEIEAKELVPWYNGEADFKLSEIKSGEYNDGVWAYSFRPYGASVGLCNFAESTSTAPEVAVLNEEGKLIFGGGCGETTISFKGMNNEDISLKVTVINDYDLIEISGVKQPVIGEKLDFDSITIPDDAPYHITDVKWYKGYDEADKNDIVEYYKPYRVEVTVESDEYCKAPDTVDYTVTAEYEDGTFNTLNSRTYREYVPTPGGLVPGQVYVLTYTFSALTDHDATTIDKVYLDFPTEVREGDSFLKWQEESNVYTNGYNEGLNITYKPLYGLDADYILKAYGYSNSLNTQLNSFVKGVQTGIEVDINIPKDLKALGDIFADKVTIYVNGEEKTITTGNYNKSSISIIEPDSLTILDGDAPPVKPGFSWDTNNSIDAVVGETISVNDFIYSDDPRVSAVLTGVNVDDGDDEYCILDYDNSTVTPIKERTPSPWNAMSINYDVVFDADGDGYPEYQESHSMSFEKIYADRSEVPEKTVVEPEPYKVNITVMGPDGKKASEDEYLYDKNTFVLPEIEGAFVSGVFDKDGKRVSVSSFKEGESYTVKTISADSIEIHSGKDTVYAFFKDQDGKNVEDLQISVDNSHYTAGDHIDGLKPDTEYTLYYKVGRDGQLYSEKFRTAKQEYGVYIGRMAVTDDNLGDLEQDGWHYDPETKTLTLKDFELKDAGVRSDIAELLGTKLWSCSTIYSPDDLTVKLIGENSIDIQGGGLANSAIWSDKKLTIEGTGDLTVTEHASGLGDYGFYSKNGDIDLNGSGTLLFDEISYAFDVENGSVNYKNGTIDTKPEIREYSDGSETYTVGGRLIPESQKESLNLSGAAHELDIDVSAEGESYSAAETFDPSSSQFLRITPEHHDVEKVVSAGYHESGSCDTGSTYHLSCDCGHIGEETFSMPAEEHSLVKHNAKPATCDKAGTAAYWECELCGEIYADEDGTEAITAAELVIPALGHELVHHEASEATCTEDGTGEHWACSRCGKRFEDKNGTIALADTVTPALGHDWIHYMEKYATCTKDGTIEHWKCANCGAYSADQYGTVLLTAEELKVKAAGHSWSEWTVIKEATETTEGEEARMCSVCGETETKVIPVKAAATTTTTSTTTTTTTSSKTTTTTSGKTTTTTTSGKTTTTTTSGKTTTTTTSGKTTTTTTSGKTTTTTTSSKTTTTTTSSKTTTTTTSSKTTTTTTSGKTTTTTTSGKTTTTTSSSTPTTTTTSSNTTTTTTSEVYRNTLKYESESPLKYTPKNESESAWSCIITADVEVESSKEFDDENSEDIEIIKNIKAYLDSALEEAINAIGDREHLNDKIDLLSEEASKIFNEGEGSTNTDSSIIKLAITDIRIVDGDDPPVLEYTLGDVNNDGIVDGSDATWVLREFGNILGGFGEKFTPEQFAAGDVDKNGVIDGSDATLILKFFGEAGKDIEISYGGMEPWMEKNFWNR